MFGYKIQCPQSDSNRQTEVVDFESTVFTNFTTGAFVKYCNLPRVKELNHLQYFRGLYKTVQFYIHLSTASSGMPQGRLELPEFCF